MVIKYPAGLDCLEISRLSCKICNSVEFSYLYLVSDHSCSGHFAASHPGVFCSEQFSLEGKMHLVEK